MELKYLLDSCKQTAQSQNLSLGDLGKEIGVERAQISHWFSGRYKPSAERLLALLDAVGFRIQMAKNQEKNDYDDREIMDLGSLQTTSTPTKTHKTPEKTESIKQRRPIRSAPAFENLTPAEIETARKLFGLDLSGNA